VFAEVNEIIRLESFGNYSFVFLTNGHRIVTSQNLKLLEEILPAHFFFRIHQSFIINTSHLKMIGKEHGDFVEMTDGAKVPLARRRKEEFIAKIKAQQ
jgi:two-component system LytT family response regulator